MSSLPKKESYILDLRSSINSVSPSVSPSVNTKEYLHSCYGVYWDKKIDRNRDSISSINMTPPSSNTAKMLNYFTGSKIFKQSFSESDDKKSFSESDYKNTSSKK